MPSPEEIALPRWLDVDQHRSVHSDKEAFHRIQQDYQRLRASVLPNDTTLGPGTAAPGPGSTALTGATGSEEPGPQTPGQGRSRADVPASAALADLLADLDLMRLRQLLLYGIERGMSCGGLWQHIRDLATPEPLE